MMETRIGKGILCAAALAGLFAATAVSASRSEGADACIQAFVAQELPQGHPVKVVKRERRGMYMSLQPSKTIVLKTKGKRTGESYGSATCFIDRDGGLLAMEVEGSRIQVAKSQTSERATGG